MKPRVLIIDDEPGICASLSLALESDYNVTAVTSALEGLELLENQDFQLVLLDLVIGKYDGVEILDKIKDIDSSISVIMMTAYGSIRSSVKAMKSGAFTYLSKPLDIEELLIYMSQALKFRSLNEKVTYLSNELKTKYSYGDMIGKTPAMQEIYRTIEKVKDVDSSVLINGDSGTGKELVARAIHFLGRRSDERFVVVNCASIPEGLLEAELFGHKKGSFTGAIVDEVGKFEFANGGTIFLDEIGDMPLAFQSKLLRVLQHKEVSPIGSNDVKKLDVRVISATNRNLHDMVIEGTFRQDLYYRLNIVQITLPPLRERKQDIPSICQNLIERHNKENKRNIRGLSDEARKLLLLYDYPGNVRELENAIEYGAIMTNSDIINAKDLPEQIRENTRNITSTILDESIIENLFGDLTLKEIEQLIIESRLKKNKGVRNLTASQLGISERGLRNKIHEYGLSNK